MNKPRYEKVDANTLKVIIEKASDVPLSQLIDNKTKIEGEIKRMQEVLKNINEMLVEAKKLGVVPKVKDKDVEKTPCSKCGK